MSFPFPLPLLQAPHLSNASLYANRDDALESWPINSNIAEIGVAFGRFTAQILKTIHPKQFDAYDLFNLHELKTIWGRPSTEIFHGKTQIEYYKERFQKELSEGCLKIIQGDSSSMLSLAPPKNYDVIYIDGDHTYEGVKKDTGAAIKALRDDGMLVFNDYVFYDKTGNIYGVVPVVHDLCVNHGWKVKYLALQPEMFCDIALVKNN